MLPSASSSIASLLLETLSDVSQNPVSITIFVILSVLIISLVIAILFRPWRDALVSVKLLEEDEKPSSLLIWIIGIIIIVKCVQAFVIQPFIVDGGSMLPTYHNGEFLLVDKFSYLVGSPKRGDVMIFKLFEGGTNPYTGKYLIKRVIGLPGERVVVQDGVTTIYNKENPRGFVVDESFIIYKDLQKDTNVTLDDHHYFMMGDNRAQSYDSRDWGPLDAKNIKGQVLFRVYPVSVFSFEPGQHSYTK
jgi:signal peptidase I